MESDLTSRLPVRQHLKNMKAVMRLLHELDRTQFLFCAARAVLTVTAGYLQLYLSARVLNQAAAGVHWRVIMKEAAVLLGAILICRILESFFRNRLSVKREAIGSRFDLLMSKKLMEMDFSLVDSPLLERLKTRIMKDNNWGAGIFTIFWSSDWFLESLLSLAGAVLFIVPILAEIVRTGNWTAMLLLLLLVLLVLGLNRLEMKAQAEVNEWLLKDMFGTREEMAKKAGLIWPFVTGTFPYQSGKDVRIYDGYELFDDYTIGRMERWERPIVKKIGALSGRVSALGNFKSSLGRTVPYFITAYVALSGALPVGSLLQYAGALAKMMDALGSLVSSAGSIALACRKQLSTLELLALQDEMYKGKLPVEKRSDFEYEIEFSHVWFQYPGAKDYALKDFSLKLRIGERLAIVGMNGSGKTTMIKLLCRFYEPQRGRILLNGVDIKKFREDEYRRLFSVVFQDLYLFPLKLGENVAGEVFYDRARVKQCLRDAGFGERLEGLPDGLDTYLYKNYEDKGVEISGGEAQKIAIARALYKEAPFILLDEPTAALDPKAEYEIYTGFDKMVGKKTAIYISHRLSSCRFCDDIAVFDEGRLVQRGSHEELVKDKGGKYFELWSAQAQYYA